MTNPGTIVHHDPHPRVRTKTAIKLAQYDIDSLAARLSEMSQAEVRLTIEVDPTTLGGMSLQIRDLLVDGTVRTKLAFLSSRMHKASCDYKGFDSANALIDCVRQVVDTLPLPPAREHIGTVTAVGDGVVRSRGLDTAMMGELVKFSDGTYGVVMDLEPESVGCIVLGHGNDIREGQVVRSTGRMINVPVGKGLTGRVVDPLGAPVDEVGQVKPDGHRPVEAEPIAMWLRAPVNTAVSTGILAIDALVPIGRGQRELIIGDRQTGKTSLALDMIANQRDTGMVCFYVAIGQRASSVARVVDTLKRIGAMDYTTVVAATASDPPALQFLAPYTAAAMAEHVMVSGGHALVVFDDLTRHASAYRAMSLLLRRPPGREAYPGDIFYLHARLLERAGQLSREAGGGSMTAIPIVETLGGDIGALIPTNIISITDGQIVLSSEMFLAGQRPAVATGLSVSRIGGDAQTTAMKGVSGRLRLELARYRELLTFARVEAAVDAATERQIARGRRLTELLKQEPLHPIAQEDQVVMVWAAVNGRLDDIPVDRVPRTAYDFAAHVRSRRPYLILQIARGVDIAAIGPRLERAWEDYQEGRGQ